MDPFDRGGDQLVKQICLVATMPVEPRCRKIATIADAAHGGFFKAVLQKFLSGSGHDLNMAGGFVLGHMLSP